MAMTNSMAAVLRQFVIEPAQKRSSALFFLQIMQLINDRSGGRYDALIQRTLSVFKPKVPLPVPRLMNGQSIVSSVIALKERGWDILPYRLPAEDIAELRRFAFTSPAYAVDPSERIAIKEDNIPLVHGRYSWRMSELLR